MTWRLKTGIVVSVATLGLIVWDFIAVIEAGSRGTISNLLLTLGYHHPVIPLFMGGLVGHLFWPGRTIGPGVVRVVAGAVILAAAIVAGFVFTLTVPPVVTLITGILLGRALVPQAPQKHGVD